MQVNPKKTKKNLFKFMTIQIICLLVRGMEINLLVWLTYTATTMLEQYTSNGLGTKFKQIIEKWAFENGVHKLESGVRHKNIRSLGNLLNQGWEIVGILHDTAFIDGEWHHEYILEKILEK